MSQLTANSADKQKLSEYLIIRGYLEGPSLITAKKYQVGISSQRTSVASCSLCCS
jgi:hypothetical protein